MKTDKKKEVLNKFTILCWAEFIVIQRHMKPTGCGSGSPAPQYSKENVSLQGKGKPGMLLGALQLRSKSVVCSAFTRAPQCHLHGT